MLNCFQYRQNTLFGEDVAINTIIDRVGTPTYIYSQAILENRYNKIKHAFTDSSAIDLSICYSVKSCSNLAVLKTLADCGAYFDVVSGGELYRVIAAGGDAAKIVYAGVGKTTSEIDYALAQDIMMFNVESEPELARINDCAKKVGKIAAVALRINPDVDANTHSKTTTGKKENKFGLDFVTAEQIVSKIAKYSHVVVKGAHVHLGSPLNTIEPYSQALDKVLPWVEAHTKEQTPFEYINCGGGLGLLYDAEEVPAFQQYADVITPRVAAAKRKLILEPGRSISGNSAVLITRVQYVKHNYGKVFVIVDAGMTTLIRPAMYDAYHYIWPVNSSGTPHPYHGGTEIVPLTDPLVADIVGPICESSDVFAKNRSLPQVAAGDLLAIFSAGAYGMCMASRYNSQPLPAECLINKNKWRIVRQRESYADLTALEFSSGEEY